MLDIDPVTILAEIINFLVLAVVLYFLLFKPIIKRINKRTEENANLLKVTKSKKQEAETKLAEIEERLANIESEIETRLEAAYQRAQLERETLLEATQSEAEKIISEAEIEAAKRQQQELDELHDKLVDTIMNISAQLLIKKTPDVVHSNLVEELTTEIWDLGKSDMHQVRTIRDSLIERTPTVFIASAKELSPEQQRSLIRTFSALADKNVNMDIEIDPNLISGIKVRIGDLIVENSLAMELTELKSEVTKTLEESIEVEK